MTTEGPSENQRYYLITRQVDDENLGVNPQPLAVPAAEPQAALVDTGPHWVRDNPVGSG